MECPFYSLRLMLFWHHGHFMVENSKSSFTQIPNLAESKKRHLCRCKRKMTLNRHPELDSGSLEAIQKDFETDNYPSLHLENKDAIDLSFVQPTPFAGRATASK
jgi:hypothetical protein